MGKRRTIIAAILVVALGATAVPASAARRAAANDVNRIITILAASGIAVVEEPSDTEPIKDVKGDLSPVRFLRSQVENMALELSVDNGVTGAQLDELTVMPEGAPTISYLIAGYVTSKATPGARNAKKIMGREDWAHAPRVEFPAVVLALFTNDMTRALSPDFSAPALGAVPGATSGGPAGGASVRVGTLGSLCTALSGFISGGVSAVYDALTFENPGDPGAAESIWNDAVKWFIEGVGTVIESALSAIFPFLPAIKTALGVIATVHAITSLLVNWAISIKASPSSMHLAVGDESAKKGEFVATVIAPNDLEWPDGVEDCADLLNVTLPKLDAKGAAATWVLDDPSGGELVTGFTSDPALNDQRKAVLHYTTGKETAKEHEKGEQLVDYIAARPTVSRSDVETLRVMLKTVILNQVPAIAAPFVNPKLEAELTPLIDGLTQVAEPTGQAETVIEYHKLKPCQFPDATIDPCLVGEWESYQLKLPLPDTISYAGATGAVMTITEKGQIKIDYNPSGTFIVGIPTAGIGGTGKLNGFGTATAKTEFEEKGIGTIKSVVASLDNATAVIELGGLTQTIAFPGGAAFNGTYEVKYLDDPQREDELTFTVETPVGPVVSVWYRTS